MRERIAYAIFAVLLIALGLATRAFRNDVLLYVFDYGGDTLWAAMTYCAFGFLFPRWPLSAKFAVALLFSWCIEFSQLYHAPWIDAVRANWYAHLVLGDTFVWSDIACYTAGVTIAALADRLLRGARR